jgi:hypothetical protein
MPGISDVGTGRGRNGRLSAITARKRSGRNKAVFRAIVPSDHRCEADIDFYAGSRALYFVAASTGTATSIEIGND